MTRKRDSGSPRGSGSSGRPSFRHRYDDLERRRAAQLPRLGALDGKAREHPSYRGALKLLNETFRKASLAQRAAVLHAADWLIGLIDLWTTML
jgi:hypothetical protein